MNCPRCGLDQPEAPECLNCGVVFAKVDRQPSARPAAPPPVPTIERPRSSLAGGLLLAALVIALGLLFFPRSPEPKLPTVSEASTPSERRPARKAASSEEAPAEAETVTLAADGQVVVEAPERERRRARFPSAWYEGHTGYRKAMQEAEEDGTPVAVYFYTDWCGYCRQLENGLLSKPEVQQPFEYLVKVKINPEQGQEERAIADQYGVTGYPSFFVLPSADGEAEPVAGQVQEGGGWRLRTPDEFVARCEQAAELD
jgi:thiol-disulfide isomerase/thioredoxin